MYASRVLIIYGPKMSIDIAWSHVNLGTHTISFADIHAKEAGFVSSSVGGNNFLNCETAVQAVAQSLENSKGLGRIREDVVPNCNQGVYTPCCN